MRITQRLDQTAACGTNNSCPAAFTTDTGDIAIIGRIASPELEASIPEGAGVGEGEILVTVPRDVLISAGWTELIRGGTRNSG
jgi:hypothetical protein